MTAPLPIPLSRPDLGDEEVAAVAEVLRSGQLAAGERVATFEAAFADYVGVEHAVAVSNGTVALQLALAASGVGPGDEVVVPPLTFFSTVSAAVHQRATPVFADIDRRSYCLSPEAFEEQITERTRAVIPVHLFGNSAEMDRINAIAAARDIANKMASEMRSAGLR